MSGSSEPSKSAHTESPGVVEEAVMLVSAVVTLSLHLYVGWHIVAVPASSAPRATVAGTESLPDGRVAVHVKLRVPEDGGLRSATVSAECASPPPSVSFSNLPESSTWRGTIVCPAGTTDPSVSVGSWVGT